jgi:hypothetical protein
MPCSATSLLTDFTSPINPARRPLEMVSRGMGSRPATEVTRMMRPQRLSFIPGSAV